MARSSAVKRGVSRDGDDDDEGEGGERDKEETIIQLGQAGSISPIFLMGWGRALGEWYFELV